MRNMTAEMRSSRAVLGLVSSDTARGDEEAGDGRLHENHESGSCELFLANCVLCISNCELCAVSCVL